MKHEISDSPTQDPYDDPRLRHRCRTRLVNEDG